MVSVGIVYPQLELAADPSVIRAYLQAVESCGYDYLTIYDHVVGADPARHPGWEPRGPGQPFYTHRSQFQEPFVLLGYAAAITDRIGLATGVLVLGQRQAALVAKQAAEIDILSGGRLRLGVGTGWNDLEYASLGVDFATRGARTDEQIAVLRRLWTEEVVTFHGDWHDLPGVGILPLPVQRPIPVWIGGESDPAYRRAARLGDGFCFNVGPEEGEARVERLHEYLAGAGRTLDGFGIEAIVRGSPSPEDISAAVEGWIRLGATHVAIDLMHLGLESADRHLSMLQRVASVLGRQ